MEAFQHFEGARNTEVTGGIGVACMHDPRSGQKRHIDADGVIKGGSARTARLAMSAGSSRVCEGMWSQRVRGKGLGQPSGIWRRAASDRRTVRCDRSQSRWL